MTKEELLSRLKEGLSGLPQEEVEERIAFYDEMIDDRMEEGLSEEEAVDGISVEEVVTQTIASTPITKLVKEKITPKRSLRAWEVVLIVLGAPLWIPLLAAALAVVLSAYVVVWSVILSLWAVEASLAACVLSAVVTAAVSLAQGQSLPAVMILGIGLFCAGVSIFMFFGCAEASKGILKLTGKAALGVKSMFIKKESAK